MHLLSKCVSVASYLCIATALVKTGCEGHVPERFGFLNRCKAATDLYSVVSYINTDKSTGVDASSTEIKIDGLIDRGYPYFCFDSLTAATDLVVQESDTGTVLYSISATDPEASSFTTYAISSPVGYGDTRFPVNAVSPSSALVPGTSYSVWIVVREDADGDGSPDSAWLTFQLTP